MELKKLLCDPRMILTGSLAVIFISIAVSAGICGLIFPMEAENLYPLMQVMALSGGTIFMVGIIAAWTNYKESPAKDIQIKGKYQEINR